MRASAGSTAHSKMVGRSRNIVVIGALLFLWIFVIFWAIRDVEPASPSVQPLDQKPSILQERLKSMEIENERLLEAARVWRN